MEKGILGLFTYVDTLLEAAEKLKGSGYSITIFSPIPLGHEIDHALGERKNYIKYLAFIGAVVGFILGIVLTLGTAALYVLPRGGRAIFPVTPTLLLSYETAILLGVQFTLMGFLVFAKLPSFKEKFYDPEVAIDSFGLLVDGVREDKFGDIEKVMREYGANEVKRIEKK